MVGVEAKMVCNNRPAEGMLETTSEMWSRRFFCFSICFSEVQAVVCNAIRTVIPNTFKIDTFIFYGIYLYVLIKAFSHIRKHIRLFDLFFVLGLTVSVLLTLLICSNSSLLSGVLPPLVLFCIPAYLSAVAVNDSQNLKKSLHFTGYILLVCGILSLFVFKTYAVSETEHSLQAGYTVSTAMIMILAFHKTKFDIPVFIASTLILFSIGSRGPFLTIAIFTVIYIFINLPKGYKKVFIITIIVIISGVLLAFWKPIIMSLITLIESWGLNTRVLTGLINADLLSDASRNALQDFGISYIKEHLLWGSGILNDRIIIFENSHLIYGGSYTSTYIHNIFIEWMMQFGAVIGIGISLFCVTTPLKIILQKNNDKMLMLLALGCGLFPLFVSFSYVTYVPFYIFLGVMMNYRRKDNR